MDFWCLAALYLWWFDQNQRFQSLRILRISVKTHPSRCLRPWLVIGKPIPEEALSYLSSWAPIRWYLVGMTPCWNLFAPVPSTYSGPWRDWTGKCFRLSENVCQFLCVNDPCYDVQIGYDDRPTNAAVNKSMISSAGILGPGIIRLRSAGFWRLHVNDCLRFPAFNSRWRCWSLPGWSMRPAEVPDWVFFDVPKHQVIAIVQDVEGIFFCCMA